MAQRVRGPEQRVMAISERRFRPDFRVAFDAWRATKPETNKNAPPGPTVHVAVQTADESESGRPGRSSHRSVQRRVGRGLHCRQVVRTTVPPRHRAVSRRAQHALPAAGRAVRARDARRGAARRLGGAASLPPSPAVVRRRSMNLVWAGLIVVGVAAIAVAAMLLVRRGAPEGELFRGRRSRAGIFGVLATGFAVLIGFVVFLVVRELRHVAERRRDRGADRRAQFETAQFMPAAARRGPRRPSVTRAPSSTGVAEDAVGHARRFA